MWLLDCCCVLLSLILCSYTKIVLYLQVLKLLDDMGLSQHKECFSSERVDGELFAECDDEILKNDLKVPYNIV